MRVIVASDGSENARAAVEWLEHFPLPPTAHVLALSVATLPYMPPEAMAPPVFDSTFRVAAERIAEDTRAALASRFAHVEAQIAVGDPREAIVRVADEWAAELIVIGARGLGTLKSIVLGSVSKAVVRWAPCPVLVVKRRHVGLERALIAVDGSPDSTTAARFFSSLPLDPRTAVRLVAVVEPPLPPFWAGEPPMPDTRDVLNDVVRMRTKELVSVLARLEPEFRGRVRALEQSVLTGQPAEIIVTTAAEPDVGLVVVGARGLGLLKRLLLGSVSEHVLQGVDCPVLIVKRR
jgi:nucleotide-binding universal stress UspA family protein